MKLACPLITVHNIEVAKKFYETALGLKVEREFSDFVSFVDGPMLQTKEALAEEIDVSEKTILMRPHNMILYFEEKNFDEFLKKLEQMNVELLHPVILQSWGQRVVRFYDPDMHIIEVGETVDTVIKSCLHHGMSVDETVKKTCYPEKTIQKHFRDMVKRRK